MNQFITSGRRTAIEKDLICSKNMYLYNCWGMKIILLWFIFYSRESFVLGDSEGRGPVFLHEPPPQFHFSNSTGLVLPCSAHGSPPPRISWILTASGKRVEDISGVRKVHSNGSLQLYPFPPSAYVAAVHATTYACQASSPEGAILSRPVKVRAVVRQYYEVQVYDEFVISGNTAVLKCHVPSFVRDYVTVTSWIRGSGEKIISDILDGGRYSVFPTGELHIRHVTKTDEFQSYQCVTRHILSGEISTSSVAGRLMVNDPRSSVPPRFTDSKSLLRAAVGEMVELPCAAQGYPIPQYKWYKIKGGKKQDLKIKEIHPNGRLRQVGGSLLIKQVVASDAGKYVCVVTSSVGEENTHTTLDIWAPLTAHITPQIQTVDVGGGASFNCTAEGFPLENITWLKDGQPLQFSSRVRLVSIKRVVVNRVNRHDHGMYQCIVSNDHDSAQGSAQLKLGDASPQWINKTGPQVVSPGAKVTLECIVQGSPPPTLFWTLRGNLVTVNDLRIIIEKEIMRDIVIGTLYIPSVSVEDGGVWSCSASNRAGRIIHNERLNVRGPPSIRPMAIRSVVAGLPSTFDCTVVGYPIDSIYWEKNGVVLPVSPRQTVYTNGTLEIREISREADSGKYTCVATAGTINVRANLQISVLVPPEVDRRLFSWGPGYPLGSLARIMCVVTRGDLPIRFRWFHNSVSLQPRNSVSIRYLDDQTSILLFTSLKESDGGNYTCVASNEVSKDSYSSNLLVKVAPSWKEEPRDVSVVVGANVKIPCNAIGSPKVNITWKMTEGGLPRKYIDIHSLGNNIRLFEDRSLHIKKIRRDQGGELLCVASNRVGSDLSKTINVVVKVPPQFEMKEENMTVTAGRKIRVSCFAYGNLPISIIWFVGSSSSSYQISQSALSDAGGYAMRNTVINESFIKFNELTSNKRLAEKYLHNSQKFGEGFLSTILISTSSRQDSEVYSCLATNVYGNDTKITNVIVQEVPGSPGTPKVTNTGSRSINLTWDPPSHDGNSVISTYRVLIINSTDSWMSIRRIRRIELPGTTITIGGLRPAHSYLMRVIAVNSIGSSPHSQEVMVVTIHEPPTIAPTDVIVVPMTSSSLKVTWELPDTPLAQLASYGYYIGLKLVNASAPFRYETLEPSRVILHKPQTLLTNLRKFSAYVVTVQAYNEAGAGPKSFPAIARTKEDVPSESPRDLQCSSLSSTSLFITWKPPNEAAVNGILEGYKLFYAASTDMKSKTITVVSTTLEELIPYTNYTITIVAYTQVGEGVRSERINCLTDQDAPGPVIHLKGLSVDRNSILLSWLPPQQENGIIIKYSLTMKRRQPLSKYSSWQADERRRFPASHSVVDSSLLDTFNRQPTNMVQMSSREWDTKDNSERSWIVPGSEDQYLVVGLNEKTTYIFNVRAATVVGEGPLGRSVSQKPYHDSPATIASFSREMTAVWGEELRLLCRVVGKPTPTRIWTYNGRKIVPSMSRLQEYPDGSLLLSEIRGSDAANYTCTVSNIHGSDSILYSVTVKASKDKGAPPSTPLVYVSDVTGNAIVLRWETRHQDRSTVIGYYVHVKREYGDWKRIEVESLTDSYSVSNLDCGASYQLYVTAFNHIGPSQPSDAIATSTLGREPIVPPRSEFLRENTTSVSLNLSAWPDGGCRITSFVIEYQRDASNNWRMVTNYAREDSRAKFVIRNLIPNENYKLRITAYNSAGSKVATYPFSTEIKSAVHQSTEELQRRHWLADASILVAVIIAIVFVIAALSVAFLYNRKRTQEVEIQQSKEKTQTSISLSPSLNGTAIIRRQSMNSMHILDGYGPPGSGHHRNRSDETPTYYTFKMDTPPPPLPSPEIDMREEILYNHHGLRRISYGESDEKLGEPCYQYQC